MPMSPDQMSAMSPQDQDQDQDQSPDESQQPTLVVEISCMPDGTYKIERETGDQEAAEMNGGGEEAGDTNPIIAKSADEVVQVVKHILDASEQSPDETAAMNKAQQAQGYSEA